MEEFGDGRMCYKFAFLFVEVLNCNSLSSSFEILMKTLKPLLSRMLASSFPLSYQMISSISTSFD
jgi:hypothetical protein